MKFTPKFTKLELLAFFVFIMVQFLCAVDGDIHYYDFVLKEKNFTKLCTTKSLLVVNDSLPGPVIRVHKGDRAYVTVHNQGYYGVTIHWHGVKQPRNPWSDGPEFITQCPIAPRSNFTYELIFSDEEGTLWWHAHSDWTRATVHGAIVVLPQIGTTFPFKEPDDDHIFIVAPLYDGDMTELVYEAIKDGTDLPHSVAYTINGEPGDFSACSKGTTYHWLVDFGKTYLLRVVNAVMNAELFFAIGGHNFTVVGLDGAYTKPIVTSYIMISTGQTMDILLTTNQSLGFYYIASRQFSSELPSVTGFDHSNGTAILQYSGNYSFPSSPYFPHTLPFYNDMLAATEFTKRIKSLANQDYPISVPLNITTRLYITVSMNEVACQVDKCSLDNTTKLGSSMNNISWINPPVDVLSAYYGNISGYYTTDFPNEPPLYYNFTSDDIPDSIKLADYGTKVVMLNYNDTVEVVFQGTNLLLGAANHPMHIHGYSFYVVGIGSGNYNNETDPKTFNLVDPPEVVTYGVPRNGWLAIRFVASNPGVWFWHCHLERHLSWGMNTVFIVKNGDTSETSIRSPPPNMPSCDLGIRSLPHSFYEHDFVED